MTKKYSPEALAKHAALVKKITENREPVALRRPASHSTGYGSGLFGKPAGFVSPRVQAIRDAQAGRRAVIKPASDVWNGNRRDTRPMQSIAPVKRDQNGFKKTSTMSDMIAALNAMADSEDS